jgi:hypothetical protein
MVQGDLTLIPITMMIYMETAQVGTPTLCSLTVTAHLVGGMMTLKRL